MSACDILKNGGNAIDAAVAVGYALAVVHPCCGNIGGGGFMVAHLANGKNLFLDFREKAPLAATPTVFQDKAGNVVRGLSTQSWLAVGVPGTVMGLDEALAQLRHHAARQGDGAGHRAGAGRLCARAKAMRTSSPSRAEEVRRKYPNVAAIFLHKDGTPLKAGERLVQPQLARTLERIAKGGTDAFYKGAIAQRRCCRQRKERRHPDHEGFRRTTPRRGKSRSPAAIAAIRSSPRRRRARAASTVCEILQIVKAYPFRKWGYASVKATHYLVEAERHAFADRNTYLGDPAFVTNPVAQASLRPRTSPKSGQPIAPDKATPSSEVAGSLGAPEGRHTTHISIVDAKGNAVGITYTLNFFYGNGRIAGDTGFFLNDEMDDFTSQARCAQRLGLVQGKINQIEPGKRPLSSMTPTIVLEGRKLFMVTGSPGGSTIISTVLEGILNVVDFGMNMQQAVDAPGCITNGCRTSSWSSRAI